MRQHATGAVIGRLVRDWRNPTEEATGAVEGKNEKLCSVARAYLFAEPQRRISVLLFLVQASGAVVERELGG